MTSREWSVAAAFSACVVVSTTCSAVLYEYDPLDRLVQVTYDDGSAALYSYDMGGNVQYVRVEPDLDGDRVPNVDDAFPFDPTEWLDTDGDSTGNNADLDDDNDGASDLAEAAEATDPLIPDVRFRLKGGLNLIALPIEGAPGLDSAVLLELLGEAVERIRRYDVDSGEFQSTSQEGGEENAVFPIVAGEGYEVRMAEDADLHLAGGVLSQVTIVALGANLIGLDQPATTAFEVLERFGGAGVVASLSRFDPESGRYETAAYQGSEAVGIDFEVRRGEAYWLFKKP